MSLPLKDDLRRLVEEAFQRRRHDFTGDRSILYIQTGSGREVVVLLEAARELSATDRALVEIFTSRLSVAFDNVILYQQLQEANARLEQRVADRTRELTSANHRLASRWTELQKVNAFKNDILSTVAHDLRNPLGVILGRAEMLKSMLPSGPETENLVAQIDHISNAARNLSDMVNGSSLRRHGRRHGHQDPKGEGQRRRSDGRAMRSQSASRNQEKSDAFILGARAT